MRASLFLCIALLAACGGGEPESPPSGSTPPELEAALNELDAAVNRELPPARPGFKVAPSDKHGLDLWNHVTDPMFGELGEIDSAKTLRKRLNPSQYAVYMLFSVDYEIGNGGLWQLYYNSTGMDADAFPALLRQVGAPGHARVLEQANGLVAPGGVPRGRAARQRAVEAVDPERFGPLEDTWYSFDALEDVVERFIRAHPRDFFG